MTDPTPSPAVEVSADFLTHLRKINSARLAAWEGDGAKTDGLFHATELGGEVGEVLNVVKKLHREALGWRGSRASVTDLADELGDVLICADKLAAHYGINLAAAAAAKFNATSDKVGLPHKLAFPVERDCSLRAQGGQEVGREVLVQIIRAGLQQAHDFGIPTMREKDVADILADRLSDAITTSARSSGEVERLQPVETAPKDGSYFLFAGNNFDGGMAVVHWDDEVEWWTLDDGKNPEIRLRAEHRLWGWLALPALSTDEVSHVE